MSTEIKVPTLPESIADALIVTWHKKEGDPVKRDEVLVDVETDKVVLEVPASEDGVLGKIVEDEGATVQAHQVIGSIEAADGATADASGGADASDGADASGGADASDGADAASGDASPDGGKASGAPSGEPGDAPDGGYGGSTPAPHESAGGTGGQTSPSVRKVLAEHGLTADDVRGTGKNGRISKADVERHVAEGGKSAPKKAQAPAVGKPAPKPAPASASKPPAKSTAGDGAGAPDIGGGAAGERGEKRVPMTRLRARIAERLLSATQNTAMLTTFNEVDMSGFIALRTQFKDRFEKSHGVKLGFMSIFLKAATEALKRYPEVNASIDGSDVVYHGYCDIGVAVSSDRGLVVPVVRNTEYMGLADIEKAIGEYAVKARDGKLSLDEMTGGTFTVSNGGVFGSLLSTPILNPPQSAILGMHATQDRPVAVDGQVVIRPMMYLALSYDHRIVDGKGAVGFLKTIKELVEDPARIVLDV